MSALKIYGSTGWQTAHIDGQRIGGLGKTTRETPGMQWYWSANGSYGHCETRDEAIGEIEKLVPRICDQWAREAAAQSEFNALPAHLQDLKSAMLSAGVELDRAIGHQPFDEARVGSARAVYSEAITAFEVAHHAWASQREAA